jgi:hypothetical protein
MFPDDEDKLDEALVAVLHAPSASQTTPLVARSLAAPEAEAFDDDTSPAHGSEQETLVLERFRQVG